VPVLRMVAPGRWSRSWPGNWAEPALDDDNHDQGDEERK